MDIKITRGDTQLITFGIQVNNAPYELQKGDNIYFTAKVSNRCDKCVILKSVNDGISYNPINKKYEITLDAGCSCHISYTTLYYDIELVLADGVVKTLQNGRLILDADITKPCNRMGNNE